MAVTLTFSSVRADTPTIQVEGTKMQLVQVTYSGTYVQGGNAVTAAQLGVPSLGAIQAVICDAVAESLGANRSEVVQFNPATNSLVVYFGDATVAGTMTEAPAAQTLTGLKVNLLVFSG